MRRKVQGETNPKKLVTNRGYLRFLDEKTAGKVVFNAEKLQQESRWDGLHGLITNDFTSTQEDLLGRYHQLWIIEESFRLNKHSLAMRPIYHFKPERVKTHILICYLAFALIRYVQHQLKAFDTPLSMERIRQALFEVQAIVV